MAVSLAVVRHHKAAQVVVGRATYRSTTRSCMWLAGDPAGWAGLHELF